MGDNIRRHELAFQLLTRASLADDNQRITWAMLEPRMRSVGFFERLIGKCMKACIRVNLSLYLSFCEGCPIDMKETSVTVVNSGQSGQGRLRLRR